MSENYTSKKSLAHIDNELIAMFKILVSAQENFNIGQYLWEEEVDPDKNYIKFSSPMLTLMRNNCLRLSILELAKLISKSKNDYYSFYNFAQRIKRKVFEDINTQEIAVSVQATLSTLEPVMKKIKIHRNKEVAHLDPQGIAPQFNIIFPEISHILSSLKVIHNEISIQILNKGSQFDLPINTFINDIKKTIDLMFADRMAPLEAYAALATELGLEDELPLYLRNNSNTTEP